MKSSALLEATRAAGSVSKLAAMLGVAPQAISQWRRVPAGRVLEIERLTGVSRHELRPDLYPSAPASAANHPSARSSVASAPAAPAKRRAKLKAALSAAIEALASYDSDPSQGEAA